MGFRSLVRIANLERFVCLLIPLFSCTLTILLISTVIFQKHLQKRYAHLIPTDIQPKESSSPSKVVILDWTWLFNKPLSYHPRIEACKDSCEITWDRKRIFEASALVFHGRDMHTFDIPPYRLRSQQYVFLLVEPPFLTFEDLSNWNGFFNWTMSHRQDSDVLYPYSLVIPREKSDHRNFNQDEMMGLIKRKKKLIAWFVSRCETPSKREVVAQAIAKYVPLDIYGRCGNYTCRSGCDEMLTNDYKFYLSFENSVCTDYVTEKILSRVKQFVIPIVLKRKIVNPQVPPSAFIAVDDFNSYKELADYLIYLDRNHTRYMEYFNWKDGLKVEDCSYISQCGICKLCSTIREISQRSSSPPRKTYSNLKKWWIDDAQCIDDYGIKITERFREFERNPHTLHEKTLIRTQEQMLSTPGSYSQNLIRHSRKISAA